MNVLRQLVQLSATTATAFILTACGGGSDAPTASNTSIASFVASYNQGLGSVSTMNMNGFKDMFDDAFLDSGYTKAQVVDNLKQDADSLTANPADLSVSQLYPMYAIEQASVSACDDATGVCQLDATIVNVAPDSTRATLTVPVRFKDGQFRLYGDQKTTAI